MERVGDMGKELGLEDGTMEGAKVAIDAMRGVEER